ncbi:MAG: P-II family nitrogen regulator [Methanomassiliicoccus sp.]|nr:P-II family nitrogen regulator [Methanomassiliicoccus sp.]
MKKIEAFVRPERADSVKKALEEAGATGMTLTDVKGRGEQKGIELINRAGKYRVDLLPKVKIEVVVEDKQVDPFVNAIIASARTGEIGDGKIFVYPVQQCIRIRTGEKDDEAI